MEQTRKIKNLQDLVLYFIDFLKSYNNNIQLLNNQIDNLHNRAEKLERCVIPIINKIEKNDKSLGEIFHTILKIQEQMEQMDKKFVEFKRDYETLTKRQYYIETEVDRVKYHTNLSDENI